MAATTTGFERGAFRFSLPISDADSVRIQIDLTGRTVDRTWIHLTDMIAARTIRLALGEAPGDTTNVAVAAPAPSPAPPDGRGRTRDDDAADLARGAVPGFAGIVIRGGRCDLVVLLTDTASQAAAARVHAEGLMARRDCEAAPIAVDQVRWDFAELMAFRDSLSSTLFRLPGLTMRGIDEGENEVAFGFEDAAAVAQAKEAAAAAGIPRSAYRIERTGPICVPVAGPAVLAWVRDSVSALPIPSGLLIVRDGAFADTSAIEARGVVGAAMERSGTYDVTIVASGFETWHRGGVRAPQARCGVQTAELVVWLQPLR